MKKTILVISVILAFMVVPSMVSAISMPCTLTLEPVDKNLKNAKGSALVYQGEFIPNSFPRTNLSILAVHLPEPSNYGDFDRYEGFAFIPEEISWRFTLYPTPEGENPTWAGRFDYITAEMKNVQIQVRPSNSKTEKLGQSVLSNHIDGCK